MTQDSNHRFFIDAEGRLHETPVFDVVQRLEGLFPGIDVTSVEDEIMIERVHRLLALDRDSQWAPYGLTGARFILLRSLYSSDSHALTMGQLAVQMNLEPNHITQLVDALVKDGLVERQANEQDKRVIFARLTVEGETLFSRVMEENAQRIGETFGVLNEWERKTLAHLLTKVRMHLLANPSRSEGDHSSDRNRVLKARRGPRGTSRGTSDRR